MRTGKTQLAPDVLASMAAGVAAAQTPFTHRHDGANVTSYGNMD